MNKNNTKKILTNKFDLFIHIPPFVILKKVVLISTEKNVKPIVK